MGKTYEVQGRVQTKEKHQVADKDSGDEDAAVETVAKSSKKHAPRKTERYDDSSSDSDTDECYEPLGMDAWRWACMGIHDRLVE